MKKQFSGGRIKIANDIMAKIVREAAEEIEEVAQVTSGFEFVNYDKFTTADSNKGIKIAVKNGQIRLDLRLELNSINNLETIAKKVQMNVKEKMEVMTGLIITEVNVFIDGLIL